MTALRVAAVAITLVLTALRPPRLVHGWTNRQLQQDISISSGGGIADSSLGLKTYIVEFSSNKHDVQAFCKERAAQGSPCTQQYSVVLLGCAVAQVPAPVNITLTSQANAPWNLQRISQPYLPLDGKYTYASDGSNVNIYILDTGVLADHTEFRYGKASQALGLNGSRVIPGYDVFGQNDTSDCFGHGTHVAGIAAGLTYGVAKNASIYAVRAIKCDGTGSASDVIAALDWLGNHASFPAVASMSLGSNEQNDALDSATQAVVALGITAVIAAGNYNSDACLLSPARIPQSITVAASDDTDTRWDNSNWGTCVDLYAPGVQVLSAMYTSPAATIIATGTSMACPHVSGVAAQYLQRNPTAPPAQVQAFVIQRAVSGVIRDAQGSQGTPNRLVQTDLSLVPGPSVTPAALAPVVLFENSFTTTASQTITIINSYGPGPVKFTAAATPNGIFGGWISVTPASGSVAHSGTGTVTLGYDVSQIEFQGTYTADVIVDTLVGVGNSTLPTVKGYASTVYIFCSDLSSVGRNGPHSVTFISFQVVQDTLPSNPAWAAISAAPATSYIYFQAAIRLSHPTATLAPTDLVVNGDSSGAYIVSIQSTGTRGSLCSDFVVLGQVPFSPWDSQTTTLCITLIGAQVTDVWGTPFPDLKNCTTVNHRPVGRLMSSLGIVFSSDQGPVTYEQTVALVAVFSEPVSGLTAASFKVSGPASNAQVAALQQVPGTTSYYQLVVTLPSTYLGPVSIALVGTVTDVLGNTNKPVPAMSFARVSDPLLETTAYRVILPPALQS